MQMRPDIQIQSMIKALTDVVLPAVDADNKLAHEQTRLVIGLLGRAGAYVSCVCGEPVPHEDDSP